MTRLVRPRRLVLGLAPAALAAAALAATVIAAGPSASLVAPAQLTPDPEVTDFGGVEVGASRTSTIDLWNDDPDGPVTVVEVTVLSGPFTIVDDGCSGTTIDSGDRCSVEVMFSPPDTGGHVGSLGVRTELLDSAVDLVGTGVQSSSPGTTNTVPPTTEAPGEPIPTTIDTPDTTVPRTDDEIFQACDARASRVEAHYPPELQMVVGREEPVTVTVVVVGTGPTTTAGSATSTTVVEVALRCVIEASLSGGGSFAIVPGPDTPFVDSFLDQDRIDWTWFVTPLEPGSRRLELRVKGVARLPSGQTQPGSSHAHHLTIVVDSAPRSLQERAGGVIAALFPNGVIRDLASLIAVMGTFAAAWHWVLKRPWPWKRDALDIEDAETAGTDLAGEPTGEGMGEGMGGGMGEPQPS